MIACFAQHDCEDCIVAVVVARIVCESELLETIHTACYSVAPVVLSG